MPQNPGPLAIMGGAFDPVHYGHLRTAYELQALLGFSELRLIPSANPPHRPPHVASNEQRRQMLAAAVAGLPWCHVDTRELERPGPSWSVVTLEELRAESGERSLCMILGMDAFLGLPGWHRWEELLELAHLVIAHRPGWQPPHEGELGALLTKHGVDTPENLQQQPAGSIYVQEVTQLDISSSAIRELMLRGLEPQFLLPGAVLDLINTTGCYATAGHD